MPWLQLTLTTNRTCAAQVEDAFQALGALSVTYGDAADQPLLEPAPGELRLWEQTRITALFEAERDPLALHQALCLSLPSDVVDSMETQALADQAWERAWLADFHPMRFGRRLWVCPAETRPDQPDAVALDLDPGLAFGTGTHPTTALCLTWLDGANLDGRRVLDFGCGSGILGIAAARLGAASVVAVDYDPQALEATEANAAKNAVAERTQALLPGDAPVETYDLVLANILAGTLVELAPLLTSRASAGADLVLSGILEDQTDQVARAYRGHFEFDAPRQMQEWVLLHGRRKGR